MPETPRPRPDRFFGYSELGAELPIREANNAEMSREIDRILDEHGLPDYVVERRTMTRKQLTTWLKERGLERPFYGYALRERRKCGCVTPFKQCWKHALLDCALGFGLVAAIVYGVWFLASFLP